jgi:hypothetical protein
VLRVQAGAGNGDEVPGGQRWLGKIVAHAEEGSREGNRAGAVTVQVPVS